MINTCHSFPFLETPLNFEPLNFLFLKIGDWYLILDLKTTSSSSISSILAWSSKNGTVFFISMAIFWSTEETTSTETYVLL
jgi:hypothetical protein